MVLLPSKTVLPPSKMVLPQAMAWVQYWFRVLQKNLRWYITGITRFLHVWQGRELLLWSDLTWRRYLSWSVICFFYYVDNGHCEDDTETLSCPCIWCGRVWQSTKLLSGTMCVLRSWSRGKCLSKLSHFTLLNIIITVRLSRNWSCLR